MDAKAKEACCSARAVGFACSVACESRSPASVTIDARELAVLRVKAAAWDKRDLTRRVYFVQIWNGDDVWPLGFGPIEAVDADNAAQHALGCLDPNLVTRIVSHELQQNVGVYYGTEHLAAEERRHAHPDDCESDVDS